MAVFLKSLDSHSAKSNDVRFYMDLLIGNSGNSQKKCQMYLNLRKYIMAQRQEPNYPGRYILS